MSKSPTRNKTDDKDSSASVMESSTTKDSSKEVQEFDIPTATELDNLNTSPLKPCNEKTKEEEDVPPDFFDDFLNQDFMAGLDVVDAWDAEEEGETNDQKNDSDVIKEADKKEEEKSSENNTKQDDKSAEKKGKQDLKESNEKRTKKKSDSQRRRDPNKTKRDIQRDKDKCAKDREVKLIKEKLKVVETGLVPPGMEMEVDLNEIQNQNVKKDKPKVEINTVDKQKSKSGETKIIEPQITERHPKLPDRRKSRSRSKERIIFRNRSRSRSPRRERKRKSRSRSPRRFGIGERLRRTNFSPLREKDRKGRDKSPDFSKREWRYASNVSPESWIRRVRSNSNESNQSDRERWLCNRNRSRERSPRSRLSGGFRRSISRERKRAKRTPSKSPTRIRCKSFLEELDAKLAKDQYYKEIHQKLNPPTVPVNPPPPPLLQQPNVVQSAPFIPSGMIYQQQQQQPVPPPYYDEQFFIGQQPIPPNHFNIQPNEFDAFTKANHTQMSPVSVPAVPNTNNNEKDSLEKLFTDKKISLSDYLHITAKSSGASNPVNIQNKIKVISRCQDAIKELSGELKKDFIYLKTNRVCERMYDQQHQQQQLLKYQSPLKKQPLVRFNFTTPQKPTEETLFIKSIQKLIGILRISNDFNGLNITALSCNSNSNNIINNNKSNENNSRKCQKVSISSQTNPIRCDDCDKRKGRIFVDQSTQTYSLMSFNVGIQVTSEDLDRGCSSSSSTSTNIMKNKSLAYLTPAELLGQTKKIKGDKSPMKQPLLDIMPEKKYQRDIIMNRNNLLDIRNYNETFNNNNNNNCNNRDDNSRYNNLNVKRPLLGTPSPTNSNRIDSFMNNPQMASPWTNPYPNNLSNQQNFMGNFNPSPTPLTRFPSFNHHPQQQQQHNHNNNNNPNYGNPLERRY